nr:hypothetical protein [uncultured Arsenicibacter sp.]
MSQLKIAQSARYLVGIDPDIERSGVAIFDNDSYSFHTLKVAGLSELQLLIFGQCPPKDTLIVVEAGWLHGSIMYNKYSYPKGFDKWSDHSRLAWMFQRGSDVGRNFGIGQTICAVLRTNGYTIEERKPVSGKWDANTFIRITGEPKGHNEEIRDAVRTIYPLIQYQLNIKKSRQQAQPQTTTNGKAKKGRGANARTKS